MYNVALIQNQSEMSHYGYADARPILEELGYQSELYTAQNIDKLTIDFKRYRFDAVIFASNALNDKTIRNIVSLKEFKDSFNSFIKNGKGCLILNQLRMAQENIPLDFLPTPLDNILAKVRGVNEQASEGDLTLTAVANNNHPCFLYPNLIDVSNVKKQCLNFRSLKGLYWHYWDNVNRIDWDLLLYSNDPNGFQRSLIIASKEIESFRILLSSLTLDWQKQKQLLQNILTYIVEGKHDTAILKNPVNKSTDFEYFIECLNSQKYPFRTYTIDHNLEDLKRNIKNGIHTTVVFGPFVEESVINNDITYLIEQFVDGGKLKKVNIAQDGNIKRFYIAGRQRYALRLLQDLELKIHQELYKGYLDGSFWSTIESLQILNDLTSYMQIEIDEQSLIRIFELTAHHDRNGSYDEVFSVTCALLWLRATYSGLDNSATRYTLEWVRNNLSDFEDREKTLAFSTIINIGVATKEEKGNLIAILSAQQVQLGTLSEIDLIVYLKAAVTMSISDIIIPIINCLERSGKNGYWIDIATTATAVTVLLDALMLLKNQELRGTIIMPKLESMIFRSMIYIQNSMEEMLANNNIAYPWDNKASTSLKCINAWLRFEELIDLPIHELIVALKSYSSMEVVKSSSKTALIMLEELRNENKNLIQTNNNLTTEMHKYINIHKKNISLKLTLTLTLYIIISIGIYSLLVGIDTSIKIILKGVFVEGWKFHIPLFTVIVTLFGVIPVWNKYFKKRWKQ